MTLENEIRRLKSESKKYQSEVWSLKDVEMKLKQVPDLQLLFWLERRIKQLTLGYQTCTRFVMVVEM